MQPNEIRAIETVIASDVDVGLFADVDVSEAIQSFLKNTGLLRRNRFSKVKTFAPRNDELNRLILLTTFSVRLSG